jgi:hypothetical protein
MVGGETVRGCDNTVSDGGEVDNGGESILVGGDIDACGEVGRGVRLTSNADVSLSNFLA